MDKAPEEEEAPAGESTGEGTGAEVRFGEAHVRLVGKLRSDDDGSTEWKGLWEYAPGTNLKGGQLPFAYSRVRDAVAADVDGAAAEESGSFKGAAVTSVGGFYDGSFSLKPGARKLGREQKVPESFVLWSNDGAVRGYGLNSYGKFSLRGFFVDDELSLDRLYYGSIKKPVKKKKKKKKKQQSSRSPGRPAKCLKLNPPEEETGDFSPQRASTRLRRPSKEQQEVLEAASKVPAAAATSKGTRGAASSSRVANSGGSKVTRRRRRLNPVGPLPNDVEEEEGEHGEEGPRRVVPVVPVEESAETSADVGILRARSSSSISSAGKQQQQQQQQQQQPKRELIVTTNKEEDDEEEAAAAAVSSEGEVGGKSYYYYYEDNAEEQEEEEEDDDEDDDDHHHRHHLNKVEGQHRLVSSRQVWRPATWDEENSEVYEGSVLRSSGLRDGYGACVYLAQKSNIYEGEWRRGREHGRGVLMNRERRVVYDGEWADGKLQGQGVYYYESGDVYSGDWRESARHGVGRYVEGRQHDDCSDDDDGGGGTPKSEYYDDDDESSSSVTPPRTPLESPRRSLGFPAPPRMSGYAGEWRENLRHGRGRYDASDGSFYDGEWAFGKRQGRGIVHTAQGGVYDGHFAEDSVDGRGVCVYACGQRYEGVWRHGRKEGRGSLTWDNGASYEGRFRDDKMDGQGTLSFASSAKSADTVVHAHINEEPPQQQQKPVPLLEANDPTRGWLFPLQLKSDIPRIHLKAGYDEDGL